MPCINYLTQVGTTEDGKIVVGGVWDTYETHGVPLEVIFDVCISRNWMPDWCALYIDMVRAGLKHSRIISKLDESITDSFGVQFCETVICRLKAFEDKK